MKTKLLLLFLFLINIHLNAQIGFEENIIAQDYPYELQSIFVEDLDGDGDMDIISNNQNVIGWHENLGSSGNFTSLKIITTDIYNLSNNSYHSTSVFASDLDGDGDMDVLSASSSDDKIAWYENIDGQGNFGSQQIITLNVYGANSVFSADIDNDGDMDVLSASWFDDKIAWYENIDGQGTFGAQQIITANADYANSVFAKDIDGDGYIDVLSASASDGKIAWYKNYGAGNFGSQQIITANLTWAYSVSSEDLDGDGDMDVLASSRYNGIKWYENLDGNGNFDAGQTISSSSFSFSVNAKDLDNDGDMDVIMSNRIGSSLSWSENLDGQGTFGTRIIINNNSGTVNAFAADMDNDGFVDLICDNIQSDRISWHKNLDGQGNFGSENIIPVITDDPRSVYSADLDGDGDMDLLSASSNDNKIAWFENVNGAFDLQRTIAIDVYGAYSVHSEDIDGDGDMDVLSVSVLGNELVWYENTDGLGTFGARQLITNVLEPRSVYADDIDNDGDIDLLVGTYNRLVWYENIDGQGTFGSQQILNNNAQYVLSIHTGDVDNDGDKDVFSISRFHNRISWYENTDGQGTFGIRQIITSQAVVATSVHVVDIDNDGDIDVLSASSGDDKIAWYENTDGLGTFGAQQIISTEADQAIVVYAVDIDNDGDMDVLSASTGDDKIAWYENMDGQGTFGIQQIITANADGASSIFCADVDNDGNIDVFAASVNDDKIALYKNLGYLGNNINGTVLLDSDLNGCDANDVLVHNIMINSSNGTNDFTTFSINGYYQSLVNEGNFTTAIVQLPSYYSSSPISQVSNFTGLSNTDVIDFCITPIGSVNDLNIAIYPSVDDPRPGFDTTYQIVYNNVGTTQLSGNIVFEFDDSKLQFLNASEAVSAQTSNTITFNYSNINPFETRTIDLAFNVFTPPTTNIDDVLVSTVTINPVSVDETGEDNIFELQQTVIGSYDPNDIRVLEGEEIFIEDADKYLHYIIRFQNTGTASAINVSVENILDNKLDWQTMQLESLSHQGRVEITDGSEVRFIFNNINLPDSTSDEPNSHGYITYKIKPKNNVVIGNIFSSTADIFFDFNPPITTNTATTEIIAPLSVTEFNENIVSIYPNPTKDIVTIKAGQNIEMVTVYDINGRLLKTTTNTSSSRQISLSIENLSKGIYFVKIKTVLGTQTEKIIKL